jgi:integrase
MRDWCDQANLRHCSAHGLRKACAMALAEAGATAHEIASVTGHQSLEEIERYTRDAKAQAPRRPRDEQIQSVNIDCPTRSSVGQLGLFP